MPDGLMPPPDENTLRILIATDNHLGCHEHDPIRGNDTFRAFEEILWNAVHRNVDFVLLGGDLFHHNKPSRSTMLTTMRIMKEYVMGDRPVKFEMLSDASKVFKNRSCANYEDPNMNIALPIFSIHGNHDDPSGFGESAALDVLDCADLLNYFGCVDDINEFTIYPVLLRKGETRLAMYGLGSIRDERLHRNFVAKKVKWARPNEDAASWFNLFVIHQNRTRHSAAYKNSIPEGMLPNFLDLVFWAHEHECKIELEESLEGQFWITQPGSSAPTSLCPGEQVKKHYGILEIRGREVRMEKIPVTSARPFVLEDVCLADFADEIESPGSSECVHAFLKRMVVRLLDRVELEHSYPHDKPRGAVEHLPLVRLRVDPTGFELGNAQRFGLQFSGKVANPDDMLQVVRRKATTAKRNASVEKGVMDEHRELMAELEEFGPEESRVRIEDLMATTLAASETPLKVLPEAIISRAIEEFVDKSETGAIEECFKERLKDLQSELMENSNVTVENVAEVASSSTASLRDTLKREVVDQRKAMEDENIKMQRLLERAHKEDNAAPATSTSSSGTSRSRTATLSKVKAKPNAKSVVRETSVLDMLAKRSSSGSVTKSLSLSRRRLRQEQDDDDDIEMFDDEDDLKGDDRKGRPSLLRDPGSSSPANAEDECITSTAARGKSRVRVAGRSRRLG